MPTLFGTDGIRGAANRHPVTAVVAQRIGHAVAACFPPGRGRHGVVIGRDTRRSGPMLEHALAAGVCAAGSDALLAGILPTPGVAHEVRRSGAQAGIVVSASHNPWTDNGIKIFAPAGVKVSDAQQESLQRAIEAPGVAAYHCDPGPVPGRSRHRSTAFRHYRRFLSAACDRPLAIKVVLDCANGAAHRLAPALFRELVEEVVVLAASPDGRNINAGCGSEHPGELARCVTATGAAAGFAFDGDADRVIAVDETGQVLSGDHLLYIAARHLLARGRLRPPTVVATVMSNLGLRQALEGLGVGLETTPVGDRRVMARMQATGAVLGGEDSGHMILADVHSTGDGLLTAIEILNAMQRSGEPLSRLAAPLTRYPQVLRNVAVYAKPNLDKVPAVAAAIAAVENELGAEGRVLVRYSGTQPLCRVMLEGPVQARIETLAGRLATLIGHELGGGPETAEE